MAKKKAATDETVACTKAGCTFHIETDKGDMCVHPEGMTWEKSHGTSEIPEDCPLLKFRTTVVLAKDVRIIKIKKS